MGLQLTLPAKAKLPAAAKACSTTRPSAQLRIHIITLRDMQASIPKPAERTTVQAEPHASTEIVRISADVHAATKGSGLACQSISIR